MNNLQFHCAFGALPIVSYKEFIHSVASQIIQGASVHIPIMNNNGTIIDNIVNVEKYIKISSQAALNERPLHFNEIENNVLALAKQNISKDDLNIIISKIKSHIYCQKIIAENIEEIANLYAMETSNVNQCFLMQFDISDTQKFAVLSSYDNFRFFNTEILRCPAEDAYTLRGQLFCYNPNNIN